MTRVASLSYACRQGLGWLMRRFFDAGIVTDPIIYRHSHPSRKTLTEWYPPGTPVVEGRNLSADQEVVDVLRQADVLLCLETFFDWELVNACRRLQVKTVLMPMYEWTPVRWPAKPDYVLCPSLLDQDFFRDEFPGRCPFVPVPASPVEWKLRTRANRWLHNAGNVGHREHKGTRQLIEAVPLVRNPDFRLTIKAQDSAALTSILNDHPAARDDPRLTVDLDGDQPWERMWDDHDVYIAPEKLNGLSLPLQEAFAAGLPVFTTDRYPANTWLPADTLIPPFRMERACITRSYREFDECVVEPATIAAVINDWQGRDVERFSRAGLQWSVDNGWAKLGPVYRRVLERIARGETIEEKPT